MLTQRDHWWLLSWSLLLLDETGERRSTRSQERRELELGNQIRQPRNHSSDTGKRLTLAMAEAGRWSWGNPRQV